MQEFYPMTSFSILNDNHRPDFTWKIEGMRDVLSRPQPFTLESDKTFVWSAYPQVEARASLTLRAEMVHMGLNLFPRSPPEPSAFFSDSDSNSARRPAIEPLPCVYYVLRDPNEWSPKMHAVRACYGHFASAFDYGAAFRLQLFRKRFLEPPSIYNADDSVTLEVYVEPPEMARRVGSRDGSLRWTVDLWGKRRLAEEKGLVERQESDYFYTREKGGVRFQAWLFLTGDRLMELKVEGTLVRIALLSGEDDSGRKDLRFPRRAVVALRHHRPLANPYFCQRFVEKQSGDEERWLDVFFPKNEVDKCANGPCDVCGEGPCDSFTLEVGLLFR